MQGQLHLLILKGVLDGITTTTVVVAAHIIALRLCLKYHPDKSGPDGIGRFQEIKVAYDVLSDTLKKAQ